MKYLRHIDWLLLVALLPLFALGLLTMKSLSGSDYFFNRQVIWIGIGFIAMFAMSSIDWRSLKSGAVILTLYGFSVLSLIVLVITGFTTRGAASWFYIGSAAIEPVEIVKFILIILFAKYFSGRYVEIALSRHIIISFLYFALPAILILMQPDLGSAAILFIIWASMVLFSGLRMRQVVFLGIASVLVALLGWFFVLEPYQQVRIIAFLRPESDPQSSGYHAIQAMIAVGSGGFWGKGVGYGTQSRLNFLPESETDFMFAAFAEEWGFIGVGIVFLSFALLFWRILHISIRAPDNFAKLFCLGVIFLLVGHIGIHVGMNLGMLPITGIGLPFMSYGGSFLVMLMAVLGVLQSIAIRSSDIKAYDQEDLVISSP